MAHPLTIAESAQRAWAGLTNSDKRRRTFCGAERSWKDERSESADTANMAAGAFSMM